MVHKLVLGRQMYEHDFSDTLLWSGNASQGPHDTEFLEPGDISVHPFHNNRQL